MDAERLAAELELLRSAFPDLEYREVGEGRWVRIPEYPLSPGWQHADSAQAFAEVAFQIPAQAGAAPYGFFVRPILRLAAGNEVAHYTAPAQTPWSADFAKFSWQPDSWTPKANVRAGSNMLVFARSFAERLGELS